MLSPVEIAGVPTSGLLDRATTSTSLDSYDGGGEGERLRFRRRTTGMVSEQSLLSVASLIVAEFTKGEFSRVRRAFRTGLPVCALKLIPKSPSPSSELAARLRE